jgi:hypothetical protein
MMRVKNKKLSDDDISQYCESVEKLLGSINERSVTKKRKKEAQLEPQRKIYLLL